MVSFVPQPVTSLHQDHHLIGVTARLRLFVADDHPLILESLRSVFQPLDDTVMVTTFATLSELEAALEGDLSPDLALIDFNMPGLASVEAVAEFVARHQDVRVAMISGQIDGQLARNLIRCGCLGFVPKSLTATAIYHAVRIMTGGGRFVPDFLLAPESVESPPSPAETSPPVAPGRHRLGLTPREVQVLRELAIGRTNKQIARELNIEEVTVKLHLRRGYAKLGVRNRIEAVRAIYEGVLD